MYFFFFNLILSSFFVIFSKNPVHSILYLIFCFLNGSGLILFLGLEFLAIIFFIIYIGAIAVLFLFVVMMLDIKLLEINESFLKNVPIIFFFLFFFFLEILFFFKDFFFSIHFNFFLNNIFSFWSSIFFFDNNSFFNFFFISSFYKVLQNFSSVLYIDFFFIFWSSGFLLFFSMLGAIILTLNKNLFIKRQNLYFQTNKAYSSSVSLFSWNSFLSYFLK